MKRFHLPEAELLNGLQIYIILFLDKDQSFDTVDQVAVLLVCLILIYYYEFYAGRAAMIGFFMAYLVDSLTGVGLVDQMSNFFCKTLLFVAVVGVLLIRKNEDLDNIKKLIEETTFYDKQWQATWQDDTSSENN